MITKLMDGCWKIIFRLFFTSKFFSIGSGSILKYPFRLDGAVNISIGFGTFFQKGLWLYSVGIDCLPAKLEIGNRCVFGYNNHITCVRAVYIGDKVLTANNVFISDNIHSFSDVNTPIIDQAVAFKANVSIGDGSWLGENVCIIGASVGKNCVIGANSVVTKDIPDYSVAVGAPAKVIKKYDKNSGKWLKF